MPAPLLLPLLLLLFLLLPFSRTSPPSAPSSPLQIDCPAGRYYHKESHSCINCPAGRYGASTGLQSHECSGTCKAGCYCPEGSTKRCNHPCPAGRFGSRRGLKDSFCSGLVRAGCFGRPGATSDCPFWCGGVDRFCPEGANSAVLVSSGYYTLTEIALGEVSQEGRQKLLFPNAGQRSSQAVCERGYYCMGGRRNLCPAGRYGETQGLADATCTAECPAGTYCPPASARPRLCPAGRFGATANLSSPLCTGACLPGYYCPEGSTNSTQIPCPAGRFGSAYGLASSECNPNCTAAVTGEIEILALCEATACSPGYYCPQASNSSIQHECGSAEYFCPLGSGAPTRANPGYYTVGGLGQADDTTATERTRHAEIECPPGYYCTGDGYRRLCAGGRYGSQRGLSSSSCSGQTNAGTYSTPGATTAQPDGVKTFKCGGSNFYCPVGSSAPLPVSSGYYSAGGTEYDARASQSQCEPGYYCKRGVRRRCAKGRYGEDSGLTEASCTAACHVGHYCPRGSSSPTQVQCPAGRYGDARGLHDDKCSGPCEPGYYCPIGSNNRRMHRCGGETVYCPEGSPSPTSVSSGYYSTGGTSTTRTGQAKCEQGRGFERVCPTTTVP